MDNPTEFTARRHVSHFSHTRVFSNIYSALGFYFFFICPHVKSHRSGMGCRVNAISLLYIFPPYGRLRRNAFFFFCIPLIFWARLVAAKSRSPVFIQKSRPPPSHPHQGPRNRWCSNLRWRRHRDNVSDRKAIFPLNGRRLNTHAMLQVLVDERGVFFSKKRLGFKIIHARKIANELDVFNTEKYGWIRDRSKRIGTLNGPVRVLLPVFLLLTQWCSIQAATYKLY